MNLYYDTMNTKMLCDNFKRTHVHVRSDTKTPCHIILIFKNHITIVSRVLYVQLNTKTSASTILINLNRAVRNKRRVAYKHARFIANSDRTHEHHRLQTHNANIQPSV